MRCPIFTVHHTKQFSILTIIWLLLAASGCATQGPVSDDTRAEYWDIHRNKTDKLNVWKLSARMSVRQENEGWSASLYWQQDHDRFDIRIIAPLGQGSVEITGDTDEVELHTDDNQIYRDKDVMNLMKENLGWEIPVNAMKFWVKGIPDMGKKIEGRSLDSSGRLTELLQLGWRVNYQAYTRVDGNYVPSRITLSREGITVRLNINRWTLSS